jgi:hypothetical protein
MLHSNVVVVENSHMAERQTQSPTNNILTNGLETVRGWAERAAKPVVAAVLVGVVATTASCNGDAGRKLYWGKGITGNRLTAVGDSLYNREAQYIKAQAVQAGLRPVLVSGMEGHSEIGGIFPSGMNLLTGTDPASKRVQAAIADSDIVAWGYGNNSLDVYISAEQQRDQDLATVRRLREIKPGIRILMPTLSTEDAVLGDKFKPRNIGREWASEDPKDGFYLIPVYEKEYGGDARHVGENPYLHFAPVDMDRESHVHPQTPDGLSFAASILISAVKTAREPGFTYVTPQMQDTTLAAQASAR